MRPAIRGSTIGLLVGIVAAAATLYLRVRWQLLNARTGDVFLLLLGLITCLVGEVSLGYLRIRPGARHRLRALLVALTVIALGVVRAAWGQRDAWFALLTAAAVVVIVVLAAEAALPWLPARPRGFLSRPPVRGLLVAAAATAVRRYRRVHTLSVKISPGARLRLCALLVALAVLALAGVRAAWGQDDVWLGRLTWAAVVVVIALAAEAATVRLPPRRRAQIFLLAGVTGLLLIGAEGGLRVLAPDLMTHPERTGMPYRSLFEPYGSWFYTYKPGQAVRQVGLEFTHARQVNSMGLADGEFAIAKAPGVYRILALGDSFTEGVGADSSSSWVKVAGRHLAARSPARRIEIQNAGIGGSDPVFALMLLRERLRPLRPDLVVVVLNESDVTEVVVRGGAERFRPDGTLEYRPAPSWEPLYARSYLVRLFVHGVMRYNQVLLSNAELARRERIAIQQILSTVRSMRRLGAADGFRLLVVIHPFRPLRYSESFEALAQALEREKGIAFVDLLKSYTRDGSMTEATVSRYFWPIDGHHNAAGYEVMGRAIARHMEEAGLVGQE